MARNKLDAKFINSLSSPQKEPEELTAQDISEMITKKEALSNYINLLNKFYEKLFRLPEKLKQCAEADRKMELRAQLEKLLCRFTSHQETKYCSGICFPICPSNDSYLLMGFVGELCHAFSTRERIPFRVVFETVKYSIC